LTFHCPTKYTLSMDVCSCLYLLLAMIVVACEHIVNFRFWCIQLKVVKKPLYVLESIVSISVLDISVSRKCRRKILGHVT